MAEREGFEPSDAVRHRLISSQVQSTTLPPLRSGADSSTIRGAFSGYLLIAVPRPEYWSLMR